MVDSTPQTGMSQESWTIIGTGVALLVALGGFMLTLSTWQRDDIKQLRADLGAQVNELQQGQLEMRERLVRIETIVSFAHPDLNVQTDTQAKPNT